MRAAVGVFLLRSVTPVCAQQAPTGLGWSGLPAFN
jgi:hypothetical protein